MAQHTPAGSQGRYAAIIDIAQDLLLADLHADGNFDHLVFKGGTALRKLYAGGAGRFSTDLDFSVRNPDDDARTIAAMLREAIDGRQNAECAYRIEDRRGRSMIAYSTHLGDVGLLRTKLDIGPPPWIAPVERGWVRLKIHDAYELPSAIPAMALAENLAEKIARLSRRTPARDVYDLVWIASNSPPSGFDRELVRRLAVLKTWVDQHGLHSPPAVWLPVAEAKVYDPKLWHRVRDEDEFDDENLGLLAIPAPSLRDLAATMYERYRFLGDLAPIEEQLVRGGAGARNIAIEMIRALPGTPFADRPLW